MIRRGGTLLAGVLIGLLAAGLVVLLTSPPRGQPISLLPPPTPQPLQVHIAGAVRAPGVYRLPQGAIVEDVLRAAGGPTDEAAVGAINLAQPVETGERVYIPTQAELDDSRAMGAVGVIQPADEPGAGRIDLNRADAPELERLPGIGPSLAQKIIDYRDDHGPFQQVDDLLNVPGIGPAKLDAIRDQVAVY